jgi:putative transposase
MPCRPRHAPTGDWQQLRLLVGSPAQETYELLRPMLLFGQPSEERSKETGVPERTLRRKAARFVHRGMRSLFDDPIPDAHDRRVLPSEIRQAIVELKAEYSPFGLREIAAICRARFRRPVSHHTVRQVLATEPLPVEPPRRFPPYHAIPDPVQRRLAVVRLARDGWRPTAIAGYLETSRQTVYDALARWDDEGWPGLEDHPRGPHAPARKVDLAAMTAVRRLQANPLLGAFRVHAALAQQGIDLSPRTCGAILAEHRALGIGQPPERAPREPHAMPFAATRWHQWWSVDVRYLEDHALPIDQPVYVLAVLENFSRAILASRLSLRQDLTAYLIVLRDAIARYGVPEGIVSDSGAIFRANRARAISDALGIRKEAIDRGQPWQNYIETMFSIMRRMADHDVTKARTWAELQTAHDRFVANYNHQPHCAHQALPVGRRAPATVLTWITGRPCDPADLDHLSRLREARVIRGTGCVRFRHWRLYGERGLAGEQAAVWMDNETLTLAYASEALAQYRVAFEPDGHHLRRVDEPHLFPTRFPSPQPLLPVLGDLAWHPAGQLAPYRPRWRPADGGRQEPLFLSEHAVAGR